MDELGQADVFIDEIRKTIQRDIDAMVTESMKSMCDFIAKELAPMITGLDGSLQATRSELEAEYAKLTSKTEQLNKLMAQMHKILEESEESEVVQQTQKQE